MPYVFNARLYEEIFVGQDDIWTGCSGLWIKFSERIPLFPQISKSLYAKIATLTKPYCKELRCMQSLHRMRYSLREGNCKRDAGRNLEWALWGRQKVSANSEEASRRGRRGIIGEKHTTSDATATNDSLSWYFWLHLKKEMAFRLQHLEPASQLENKLSAISVSWTDRCVKAQKFSLEKRGNFILKICPSSQKIRGRQFLHENLHPWLVFDRKVKKDF